jgi:hypothetical protein
MLELVFSLFFASAASPEAPTQQETESSDVTVRGSQRTPKLRAYLSRDVANGPRHLDHGVLGVGVAGGFPHLYRVQLSLGLLDHLTVGATAHWLPGQAVPQWSPMGSLALWRDDWVEVGASYRQILHPPPRDDEDPETFGFQSKTHYILAGATFSRAWYSAGLDFGVANLRLPDLSEFEPDEEQFVRRTRLAGGLHLRIGTRRFGVTFQGFLPDLSVEALVDVRFGLFEMRRRGGWLTH